MEILISTKMNISFGTLLSRVGKYLPLFLTLQIASMLDFAVSENVKVIFFLCTQNTGPFV